MNKSTLGFGHSPIARIIKIHQKMALAFFLIFYLITQSSYAQPVIAVPPGGDWDVPATWSGGVVPTASDQVIIGPSTTVTIRSSDTVINNNSVVVNQGTLIVRGSLTANSALVVIAGSTLSILDGFVENYGNLNNLGEIYSEGTIINHGILTNSGEIRFDGIFTNEGDINNQGPLLAIAARGAPEDVIFTNNGTFNNDDVVDVTVYGALFFSCEGEYTGPLPLGGIQPCDCVLSDWMESECSVTCGEGIKILTRVVIQEAKYGGMECDTMLTDTVVCILDPCLDPCALDAVPPSVTATLEYIGVVGGEEEEDDDDDDDDDEEDEEIQTLKYRVSCQATDNCDESVQSYGHIATPSAAGFQIKYKTKNKKKLKFKLNNSKLTVEGPDPHAFWDEVELLGGVEVVNEQKIKFKPKDNGKIKFKFKNNGKLKKVKAPSLELVCVATDLNGNIGMASTTVTGNENASGRSGEKSKNFTLLETKLSSSEDFLIHPNPVQNFVNLQYKAALAGEVVFSIYSLDGRMAQQFTESAISGNNAFSVPIVNLIDGIYIMEAKQGERSEIQKLVIQH